MGESSRPAAPGSQEQRVADVAVDDVVQAAEAERRVVRHQPRAVVGRIDLDFYSRLGELGRVVEDGQAEDGRQLDARLSHRAQTRRLHSRAFQFAIRIDSNRNFFPELECSTAQPRWN